MAQQIVINWNLASFTGWGVYGLNLALNWANDPRLAAVASMPLMREHIVVDPLRMRALEPFFRRSAEFQAGLKASANGRVQPGVPVLTGLNHNAEPIAAAHNVTLDGQPTIGTIFFEEAIEPAAVERLRHLPFIVTGCRWNEDVLRAYGVERVQTVLQGIDPTVFYPAPKMNVLRDRFLIFSGGKAEMRKGQDIVMAAFKIFAERHPEALLVTAWHSPWPEAARTLDKTAIAAPTVFRANGPLDVAAWAAANRIAPDRVIDLGIIPNTFMPPILREMDVALFTNRAEGGTNLVAMECMACGLPVILSQNTGHADLIDDANCYPLQDQRAAPGAFQGVGGVPGWGESQVDEVVATLEQVFADRVEANRRGARAAVSLSRLTWSETARQIAQIVLDQSGAAAR